MSAPPYMKLYIAEYLAETTHLDATAHGAYMLLIMAMWRTGGKLPRDEDKLARVAQCTADQWAAVRADVLAFFRISGGIIRHKRVSEELAKYDAVVDGAKRAGKASAGKRSRKNNALDVNERPKNVQRKSNQIEPERELEDKPPTPLNGGEQDSSGEDAEKGAEPAGRRKPKRPIPADFPSSEEIAAEQAKARAVCANVDLTYQAQRFRNWAEGGDHRYADWPKTWQNWCLKTVREAPKTAPVKSAVAVDPNERWRRSMRRFKASQYWNTTDDGPQPGKPNCQVPAQILAEFGIEAPSGDLLPFPVRSDAA